MRTREEILAFALSFPDTYQDAPFRDDNWQLVRVKGSKKAFLWTYERNGYMNLNVKVDPEWRDYWREGFSFLLAGRGPEPGALEYDYLRWKCPGRCSAGNDRRELPACHRQPVEADL